MTGEQLELFNNNIQPLNILMFGCEYGRGFSPPAASFGGSCLKRKDGYLRPAAAGFGVSVRDNDLIRCANMSFLRSVAKEALDHVVSVTKYLCCLHIANTYACTLTLVSGPSMLPTLNLTGDLLLVERVSPKLGKVRPGDVVLVKSPVEPRKNLAKRVIALEGDKVTSFVDPLTSDQYQTIVVPRGHVWIQGDNLYASRDSRHYGPVPYGLIQGKVFCRLWPLNSFGSLDR